MSQDHSFKDVLKLTISMQLEDWRKNHKFKLSFDNYRRLIYYYRSAFAAYANLPCEELSLIAYIAVSDEAYRVYHPPAIPPSMQFPKSRGLGVSQLPGCPAPYVRPFIADPSTSPEEIQKALEAFCSTVAKDMEQLRKGSHHRLANIHDWLRDRKGKVFPFEKWERAVRIYQHATSTEPETISKAAMAREVGLKSKRENACHEYDKYMRYAERLIKASEAGTFPFDSNGKLILLSDE